MLGPAKVFLYGRNYQFVLENKNKTNSRRCVDPESYKLQSPHVVILITYGYIMILYVTIN